MRSLNKGIDLARGRNGAEGMRWNKKRTVHCNGEHRGSKFAPPEKGAEFRRVLNYERVYRIFERSKANEHENVCDF